MRIYIQDSACESLQNFTKFLKANVKFTYSSWRVNEALWKNVPAMLKQLEDAEFKIFIENLKDMESAFLIKVFKMLPEPRKTQWMLKACAHIHSDEWGNKEFPKEDILKFLQDNPGCLKESRLIGVEALLSLPEDLLQKFVELNVGQCLEIVLNVIEQNWDYEHLTPAKRKMAKEKTYHLISLILQKHTWKDLLNDTMQGIKTTELIQRLYTQKRLTVKEAVNGNI